MNRDIGNPDIGILINEFANTEKPRHASIREQSR